MNEATTATTTMQPFLYHQLMVQRALRMANRRREARSSRRRRMIQSSSNNNNMVDSHVKDAGDKVLISMDVPGIQKKDLMVHVEDNLLTVQGVRHMHFSEGGSKTQSFQKQFSLKPGMIDTSRLTANLASGVLVVTAWKKEKREPVMIEVTENPHDEENDLDTTEVQAKIVDLVSLSKELSGASHTSARQSAGDDDDDSAEDVTVIASNTTANAL